jgi:hypothetical protein
VKALPWHGRRDVRVTEVPDPRLEEPTDAPVLFDTVLAGAVSTWSSAESGYPG